VRVGGYEEEEEERRGVEDGEVFCSDTKLQGKFFL
jgi:hypothetical protein